MRYLCTPNDRGERMTDKTRTPVIVAVAQTIERDEIVTNLDLAERVTAEALAHGTGLAKRLQRVTAVGALLAPAGPRLASEVCDRVGADPAVREQTTTGGNTPQWLVTRAAAEIAAGSLDATLIVGAEAARSHRASGSGGATPFNAGRADRAAADADPVVGSPDKGFISSAEVSAGLVLPTTVYPVFESALAAEAGRTLAEQRRFAASVMAPFTEVAATNPYAWFRDRATTDELASTDGGNRITAEPYTKRMNAFPYVDQAAALVVCSLAVAEEVGLADDAVHVWSGADAVEVLLPGARRWLGRSEALEAVVAAAFEAAGIGADDVDAIDVYSCFPVAVQMAARALGVAIDDERGLTVTGGLPYAGGPGNNYTTHGIAAMVERLRSSGGVGVCTGLGGYATKHAVGVYGTEPALHGFRHGDTAQVQAQIDATALPLVETAEQGAEGTVAGSTVQYDAEGAVSSAPVIATLDDGRRVCARAEPSQMASLAGALLVGRRVRLVGSDGPPTYELRD
jgi:acetyl-CoA C-acetyltransferase